MLWDLVTSELKGSHQQGETQTAYSKPDYFFFCARIAELTAFSDD